MCLSVLKLVPAEDARNAFCQFQIEIGKISCCGSHSPDNVEISLFTFTVLQRMRIKKCTKNYNTSQPLCCLLNLLFGEFVFAIVVVFCTV